MFSISPRFANDYPFGLVSLMNDVGDLEPFIRQRQRDNSLVRFTDGTLGHASGRVGESQIQNTDKEFRIRLDLSNYSPEEVKISSDGKSITVHAKHEERQDNHGYISREMKRVYKLPNGVDPNSATSTMNEVGTLFIKLSKVALEAPKETKIPVEFKEDKQ